MTRKTKFLALSALAFVALAAPAIAEPAVEARMPVIVAHVEGDVLKLRLPRGAMAHTRASMNRTLTIQAIDANGKSLGSQSIAVGKRLTYASVTLSPVMAGAARLVVTGY